MKVDLEEEICWKIGFKAPTSHVKGILEVTASEVLWKSSIVKAVSCINFNI